MKRWHQSKTLWFNLIVAILIALEASLHHLSSILPIEWYGVLATVLAVGNSVLRVITTTEIIK